MSDMPPQDERATPAYKAARLAVIILSGLIILALIALVVGGITRLSGKPAAGSGAALAFTLPRGTHILEMQSQPGRMLLHVRTPDGEAVEIIDIQDGHHIGTVRIE